MSKDSDQRSVYVALTDLTSAVTEHEIRTMLQPYGAILSYTRPPAMNGRIGPDAYAEMAHRDAEQAIQALDGRDYHGHFMTMHETKQIPPEMEPADRRIQGPSPRRTVLAPSVRPDRRSPEPAAEAPPAS